jgi:uncharacterized protein
MELSIVNFEKPEAVNVILAQSHFIKTVEDVYEALVGSVPGIQFGLAFCEASGKCLIRRAGTDPEMIALAQSAAEALGAGHSLVIMLGEGYYPVNVLNALKRVPEVCRVFCATANPLQAIIAQTEQGRGILGVIDGSSPAGVEGDEDIAWRTGFLRQIGYKLG